MPRNFFAALDSDEEEAPRQTTQPKAAAAPARAANNRAAPLRNAGGRGGNARAAEDYRPRRDNRGADRRQCVIRG